MLHHANALLSLSIVLLAGVSFGLLAGRFKLPSVTGQILIGIAIGPSALGVLDAETLHNLQPLTHFALGLIAVTVGSHLQIKRLKVAKRRLSLLLLLESTITPALVTSAIYFTTESGLALSLLIASLAVSTAPATIVALVRESRAKGVFVNTLMAAVALNNIACICVFELAFHGAKAGLSPNEAGVWQLIIAPLQQVAESIGLGIGAGLLLIVATRNVLRTDRLATASMIAILGTAGLSELLGLSSLLASLFLGVTLANVTPNKEEVGHWVFSDFESAIFAVFFTLAGMELNFKYLLPGGLLALLLVGSRAVGKVISARLAMTFAGATEGVKRYLGWALIPQAGVAVGLLLKVQNDPAFGSLAELLLAVGLTSVTLNELIGPVLTRFAIHRSKEAGLDRPRLIDFLQEQHITTDLPPGASIEETIEQLSALLWATHGLKTDRGAFVEKVLAREREFSSGLGQGLAIPHGALESGDRIVGVMGICSEGLGFKAPDGAPVHCVVLIATPDSQRDHYLEVIAALARAVSADRVVRNQLYNTRSPAHAYELLHADSSQSFNYFLDDERPVTQAAT